MDDIERRIKTFIEEEIAADERRWRCAPDTPLLGQPLDSLGLVELIEFLETEFEVRIDDEDLERENFSTLAHISGMVRRKLSTRAGIPSGPAGP